MSAWLLPDHIADVLPCEARRVEDLRRELLDTARSYGYELVMPPLIEHLESLLSGTGKTMDLLTFKLVDQASGRMLGVRADTTPQVARIDAHLLNRQGVTRLCYCGPVAHVQPDRPHATREPLQFGAEIYGHSGPEADLEALTLARDCLAAAQVQGCIVDLGHARIIRSLLADLPLAPQSSGQVYAALAAKDASALTELTRDFPAAQREGLRMLLQLYGDVRVLREARRHLPASAQLHAALDELQWLAERLQGVEISFDLADLRGYAYYSGARFSIYAPRARDALVRGGRYDEVGAVFGRNRPAAGFSLDVRELVQVVPPTELRAAILAPWVESTELQERIAALRQSGETVVCLLPGHDGEIDEFDCDRQLVLRDGRWIVQAL